MILEENLSGKITMSIEKTMYRSGPYQDYFAQGLRVENVLYMSGQVGIDQEGKIPASLDEQVKIAYANMKDVLSEFGANMGHIVDETYFVVDMDDFMQNAEAIYASREAAYGGNPEVCQTLIQVVALADPNLKIEIKSVAHL